MPKNPACQQVVSCFNVTRRDAVFIAGEGGKKTQLPVLFLREDTFCEATDNFPSACTFVANGQSHVFKVFTREVF